VRPGRRRRCRGRPPAGAGRRPARPPFGYRWRVELRHAELASRLDPPAAEALLELARTYGSTKYLALARLDRRSEAAGLVAATGFDYLRALCPS
jgi:hypothetical protein